MQCQLALSKCLFEKKSQPDLQQQVWNSNQIPQFWLSRNLIERDILLRLLSVYTELQKQRNSKSSEYIHLQPEQVINGADNNIHCCGVAGLRPEVVLKFCSKRKKKKERAKDIETWLQLSNKDWPLGSMDWENIVTVVPVGRIPLRERMQQIYSCRIICIKLIIYEQNNLQQQSINIFSITRPKC